MNIIQVYKQFPTQEACIKHLEKVRWNNEPVCPYCKSKNCTPMPKELRHKCYNCNMSFSVTVGTIFHKTKCDLQKWFLAISLVTIYQLDHGNENRLPLSLFKYKQPERHLRLSGRSLVRSQHPVLSTTNTGLAQSVE